MLTTDALDLTIGAALEQDENGNFEPLGFFSRKLASAKKNYHAYDCELLGIYAAIKFFEPTLDDREFRVRSDQKPLPNGLEQPIAKETKRQLQQLEYIAQLSVNIEHIFNHDKVTADALSRIHAIFVPTLLDATTMSAA